MNYLSLDYLIVYAFLLITLYIGLRAGKGIKDIREYAIANKTYGTGALVLTYLATDIGGGTILDNAGSVFSDGIIMLVAHLGVIFAYIIRGIFIAPQIVHFHGCLTMGDVMERLYGTPGKALSGILGTLNAAIIAAMQLILFGAICQLLLGVKPIWAITLGGFVMAAYSAYGGIKAVTATDIFQFLVFVIIIPIIASKATGHAGGIKAVFCQLPPEKFSLVEHSNFSTYLFIFLMWGVLQVGLIDPAIVQRLLMGQNKAQLRNQYLILAGFDPALRFAIMLIALAGVLLYPTIEPQNVVMHIIENLLPVGVKGIAMAGVLGALMSTGDSYLHAAGLMLARDVVKPLYSKSGIVIDELKWARGATLLTGLGAILIGLQAGNILELDFIAAGLIGPLLVFPFTLGVVGLKTDQNSFYISIIFALLTFVVARLWLPAAHSHFATLISTLASGIGFFGTHVLQHGGLAVVRRDPVTTRTT